MANSDEPSNYVIPLSDENKEEINVVKLPDNDSREVKVWMREDGTDFARTSNCEAEKPRDAKEGNREDNKFDSACSVEKKEDFNTGIISNNNLAQAIALIEGNELGITIHMVSETGPAEIMVISDRQGESDVLDNSAMSKIDHGHVVDGREEIIITATKSDTDVQNVAGQSDGQRKGMSNTMINSHEQDTDISTLSPILQREPVSKSNRKEEGRTCIGPISNRNYRTYRRDIDFNTGPISSTNFQYSVAMNDHSEEKLKISKTDILKPKKQEQRNISRVSNTKSEILGALNDKDEKSVMVSQRKPQHVVPLLYNIEEDINVQETSDHDGEESNYTTISNADFEGVRRENEDEMDISDYPNSQVSMALINENENVVWYNYVAKVREQFKNFCVYLLIFKP